MFTFTLPGGEQPAQLSKLLRRLNFSLTLRRKLKRTPDAIRVNGRPVPWQTAVTPGDVITISWPDESTIAPLSLPLAISYEDEHLLVVDKPAGLLVHPASGTPEPTLANAIVHHLRTLGEPGAFHPVHRLDRNTSGLILIAKNPYVQHLLSSENAKPIERSYLALVTGHPLPPAGVIDAPVGRLPGSIIERTVCPDGKTAATIYETVTTAGPHSVVRLRLLTGRTHQIRVHLAHLGHPILGDDLYGGSTALIARPALHAAALAFSHPIGGERISLSSALPPDMAQLLDKLHSPPTGGD
ncbi:RluA family pseudouridine synthase [Anaeroselena agilis]|uniref:Pseudouridine synthase n=1 Tax=Anaeroselena agilis TaxID=3063788 RepID=A0ABU3NW75_9FIRM|nr:RluA family pseudouridine synthase [Selenomonadales bacterium 4137-cl]